jgi:hypothetical protein
MNWIGVVVGKPEISVLSGKWRLKRCGILSAQKTRNGYSTIIVA